MKAKLFLLLIVPLFALFLMVRLSAEDLPVLSPDGSAGASGEAVNPGDLPPGPASPKPAAGPSIMTAEQGEELAKKIDKVQDDQKKIIEKLDQLQKDLEFVKVSVRTR